MRTVFMCALLMLLFSMIAFAQFPQVDIVYQVQIAWDPKPDPAMPPTWIDINPFSTSFSEDPLGAKQDIAVLGQNKFEFMGIGGIYWSDGSIQELTRKKVTTVLNIDKLPGAGWYQSFIIRVRADVVYNGTSCFYTWSDPSDIVVMLNVQFKLDKPVFTGSIITIKP